MITDFTKEHPDRTLWRFWIPMMFSVMFQQIYNIADSMIAGRFAGEDALAAVGAEIGHRDAHRHAGAAGVAIGAVGEDAAAPEAVADELAVDGGVDQVAGRGDLGARLALGQVGAGVGRGGVELQQGVGIVLEHRRLRPGGLGSVLRPAGRRAVFAGQLGQHAGEGFAGDFPATEGAQVLGRHLTI